MTINPIDINLVQPLSVGTAKPGAAPTDFTQMLESAMTRVENSGRDSAKATEQFLTGETQDLHSVAMAGQKASLEFEMMLQVRNKIVQAYQEIMRMQV